MVDLYLICPYKAYFKDINGRCKYLNSTFSCPLASQFNNIIEADRNITPEDIKLFINMSSQPAFDKKYDDACYFLSQYTQNIYAQYNEKQDSVPLRDILLDIGKEALIELFPEEHIKCVASDISIIDSLHKAITSENKTYHSVACALKICKFVYQLLSKNK